MRKLVKTLAICAMTAVMAVGMGCVAFAEEVDEEMLFKVVGAEGLVGEEWKESAQTESTEPGAPGEMGLMTETETKGIYSVTLNVEKADDGTGDTQNKDLDYEFPIGYEFKILRAADIYAWTYQCCLGNPYMAWGDNQTQFKLPADFTGEVTIYLDINTGAVVCADKDGKAIDYIVRWKSRDEDPWYFTAVDKAEIEKSKNESTGVQNTDCNDVAQLNADLAEKVGVEMEAPASPDDNGEDTTEANNEETTTPAVEEESSSNTGVIVVVVIVVVVVIAGVAIVLTKKKN